MPPKKSRHPAGRALDPQRGPPVLRPLGQTAGQLSKKTATCQTAPASIRPPGSPEAGLGLADRPPGGPPGPGCAPRGGSGARARAARVHVSRRRCGSAPPPTYLHKELDLGVPVVPVRCRRVRHAVGARGHRPGSGRRQPCGARASALRSGSCPGGPPFGAASG